MKKKLLVIFIIFSLGIVIYGLNSSGDPNNIETETIEKFAIMQQATSNSFEYKIDLGTGPEYATRTQELNKSLSKLDNQIDALDYILKQGFELYYCLYKGDGNKIVFILREKK